MKMRTISLGWGVQSFTLAVMAALGDIPPVDVAIHADTTYERGATYDFAAKWAPWLDNHGVRVVTVEETDDVNRVTAKISEGVLRISAYSVMRKLPDGGTEVNIPAHTASSAGGMLRRQCTQRWKIAPMRRWLQANRNGKQVETLLGISLDEFQRMRDSDVGYITHSYPLIDMRMTRLDCVNYLQRNGVDVPVKSSCVFCPFHNKSAWREMAKEDGDDWRKAVAVDEALRKVRPPYDLFVHSSRIPLAEVDMRSPEDFGQLAMFDESCDSGYCFV